MGTLRDDLLPVVNGLRGLAPSFGLRRFSVILRRRIWSGTYPGDGTATNQDIVLSPLPFVRQLDVAGMKDAKALEYILQNGPLIRDRFYRIDRITPAFTGGGYTPQQLRMRPSPDSKNVEPIVLLVGDDGFVRECAQLALDIDRSFRYSMIVQETDRPHAAITAIAITPNPAAVAVSAKLQLTATATFSDGGTGDVTPLCQWQSTVPAVATVDLLGVASGVSGGTSRLTATLGTVTAPAVTVTVS